MVITANEAQVKWKGLNEILFQYQSLWKLKPFEYFQIPWQESYPELANWLLTISDHHLKVLSRDAEQLNLSVYQFLPEIRELDHQTQLLFNDRKPIQNFQKLKKGVRGRKWQQIVGFVECLPLLESPVLEWCSGKAHLGRLISEAQCLKVSSLEKNPDLCLAGNKISEVLKIPVNISQVDVLSEAVFENIPRHSHIVALHACGMLHHRLLNILKQSDINGISLSPCCYHRMNDDYYSCFSSYARDNHLLKLNKHDLHLPLQDVVVASDRTVKLRQLETRYRLAFDVFQRDVTGSNSYLTVPSVPNHILEGGFKNFLKWASQKYQFPMPNDEQLSEYEQQGKARGFIFSRIELIRYVFRRALEVWLVLDMVIFLIESGYQTDVGLFCNKRDTPRNIIINANKRSQPLDN